MPGSNSARKRSEIVLTTGSFRRLGNFILSMTTRLWTFDRESAVLPADSLPIPS